MRHTYFTIAIIIQFISFKIFAQENIQTLANNLAESYLKNNSGSIVIGIHQNGKEKIFYYGETENGNKTLPNEHSVFEIGQLTETFTSILFADRTWKGVMHIDDKLQDYLPVDIPALVYQPVICKPVVQQNDVDYGNREGSMKVAFTPYTCTPDTTFKPQPVLLCYLASHTSGLPDKPDNFHSKNKSNPYADYTEDDMYSFLRKFQLEEKVGFDYKHSSFGIAVLGKAITLKMKSGYEQVLKNCILDSLKMNETTVSLDSSKMKNLVTGYNAKGKKAVAWNGDVYAPVMGLHSTPIDMMTFLRSNISTRKNYYSDLLDFTHNSRLKPGGLFSDQMEIGMGWKIIPVKADDVETKIVCSSGTTDGYASYVGFVEPIHTGVFILTSVGKDVDKLGEQMIQLLIREKL